MTKGGNVKDRKGRSLASSVGQGASDTTGTTDDAEATPLTGRANTTPAKAPDEGNQKTSWPADRVERRPVAELVPYARNARTHSKAQVRQIADAIEEWGWTNPILVNEAGEIIAGHGRVLAAKLLGIKEVPVMVAEGWSEAQRRAYTIADNQLALNSGWDAELLKLELGEIKTQDAAFDLNLTGLSGAKLALEVNTSTQLKEEYDYSVIIDCDDENHQRTLVERLEGEGLKCRLLTL